MTQCPTCLSQPLKPVKLEPGLFALGCGQCNGALVSLLYYRGWLESEDAHALSQESSAHIDQAELEEMKDSYASLNCPKCKTLMLKFKVSGHTQNRLDLCPRCDETWLDGGEWPLLKSLELSHNMPRVFTEKWQRQVRKQAFEVAREERLGREVDKADLEKAKETRDWLKNHAQRHALLFFIKHQ